MSTCKISERFRWIRCQLPSIEGEPDGLCLLHSRQADKDKDGSFTEAVRAKLDQEDFDFSGVFFPGDIRFFQRQEIKKYANFSWATFLEVADFYGATFSGEADFSEATFSGEADYKEATFSGKADFSGAKFSGKANFRKVTFEGKANFFKSTFEGEADFREVKFSGDNDFMEASFSKEAKFSRSGFSGEADFSWTTFSGKAGFSGDTFSGKTNFFEATFSREADFSEVTFSSETKFSRATFLGKVDFSKAIFYGEAIFNYINQSQEQDLPFLASLQHLRLETQASIRFENVSLAQVRFSHTNLRRIRFFKVDWHRLRGRNAVYDEVLLKEDQDYDLVEELYRHLKLNYEREGDYKKAGDFHYGEMEMHRKANRKRRWFSWYFFYWALSGYGEKPLWAFGWLMLMLFGLAGLVWGLGLEIVNPRQLAGFGDSFIYILQKATFQRPEWAKPVTFLGQLLSSLSVLVLPGQAALFLLALRNRLGRRR